MTHDERAYYALTRRTYASWFATFYDAITWPARWVRSRVPRLAGIQVGTRAIDVATGTGAQARAFADAGAHVLAIDLSPRMLAIAGRRRRRRDIDFVEADATALPTLDASFDVACVSFASHEMPAGVRAIVVAAMARVTRPGGTVVVVVDDYALPRNRVWRWLVCHVVNAFEPEPYVDFVRSDLVALLARSGIALRADHQTLLGAARIAIGVREV